MSRPTSVTRQRDGKMIALDWEKPLGIGGEGGVFIVPGEPELVAKVYTKPTSERALKLRAMVRKPPRNPTESLGHCSITWPLELLISRGEAVGFLMPRLHELTPLFEWYTPVRRLRHHPSVSYRHLWRAAGNLAASVQAIHDAGYVIGDLNESNVIVTRHTLVSLVDTDSFQITDGDAVFRSLVGKPEFTPPELQKREFSKITRTPEHDRFGLAVLVHLLLFEGEHPFSGRYTGAGDPPPLEDRIKEGCLPIAGRGPFQRAKGCVAFETLPRSLRELFGRAFVQGHSDPSTRPLAREWYHALQTTEEALIRCAEHPSHVFVGETDAACLWCTLQKETRFDHFPGEAVRFSHSGSRIGQRPLSLPAGAVTVKPRPAVNAPQAIGTLSQQPSNPSRQVGVIKATALAGLFGGVAFAVVRAGLRNVMQILDSKVVLAVHLWSLGVVALTILLLFTISMVVYVALRRSQP